MFSKKLCLYAVAMVLVFISGFGMGRLDLKKKSLIMSEETMKKVNLMQEYVDYGIQTYCEVYGMKNEYQCNVIEDKIEHIISISADNSIKVDVPIDIIKGMENDKYFYKAISVKKEIYILVDTYRMKIFVYDASTAEVQMDNTFDSEAFKNDLKLEDCVESDWNDVFIGEYWNLMKNKMKHLRIPKDTTYFNELYGEVAYVVERYCVERQLNEEFFFDADDEKYFSGNVTNMVFTIRLENENRIVYIDIDTRRHKYHVYEVKANNTN